MKKLLVLSGNHSQIPVIQKAREMGHYVITCDYLEENSGHQYANEHYKVSYTNKEAVLALAQFLKIDGILCFTVDAAAPTVAYVAERLGLPSHPYKSVEILSNKEMFRAFLRKNYFNVPKAKGYSSLEEAKADFSNFKLPVMIKPVDSSGSRGISKIYSIEQLEEKIETALQYSLVKRFIIEEFVEKVGYQVGGDGFFVEGRLVFRCFSNGHFSSDNINPFVPIGGSWPSEMPQHIQDKIHNEIQKIIHLLQLKTGPFNFDIQIDEEENVYVIEMGARNGGNLIPQVIKYATGVDLIEYSIKAALGEECNGLTMVEPKGYWSSFIIHSQKKGLLKEMVIDEDIQKKIIEYELMVKPGDLISTFTGTHEKLGNIILKYESMEEMLEKMDNTINSIKIIVEENVSSKKVCI